MNKINNFKQYNIVFHPIEWKAFNINFSSLGALNFGVRNSIWLLYIPSFYIYKKFHISSTIIIFIKIIFKK